MPGFFGRREEAIDANFVRFLKPSAGNGRGKWATHASPTFVQAAYVANQRNSFRLQAHNTAHARTMGIKKA